MKCSNCLKEFEEKLIEESHDVPCYLFEGDKRNERKNKADKYTRRWLCHDCHIRYEKSLRRHLQYEASKYAIKFFTGLPFKQW